MDLELLTKTIITNLVSDKEKVSVVLEEIENEVIITAHVSNEDMGKVIGKDGKTIKSIRIIVQASAYINKNKKVNINVLSL